MTQELAPKQNAQMNKLMGKNVNKTVD